MNLKIKKSREEKILQSAEKICFEIGYPNFKMSDVSKDANCSKTTLYKYFKSKESLYLAITHKAFLHLLDYYYYEIENGTSSNGFNASYNLFLSYLKFSEEHFNYYNILLDYLTFIRKITRNNNGDIISIALNENVHFKKVKNIHNIPRQLIVAEIKKGQKDGSIKNNRKPELIYLTIWSLIIGFSKLNPNNGNKIFSIQSEEWRNYILENIKLILHNET